MNASKFSLFLPFVGIILVQSSEIEFLQIERKIENSRNQPQTTKLLNRIAIDLLESYSKPEDSVKMKMTDKQWSKIIGPLNLFPNESFVQLFRHKETNEMISVDSKNLFPNEIKEEIELCFIEKDVAESAYCLECLFDRTYGFSCLYSAASPFINALIVFIAENVDFERFRFKHPLSLAARYGVEKAVVKLIERGANVEAADQDGWAALHLASSYGRTASCKALLEGGANVNAQRGNGMTALTVASQNRHVAVVELLLKMGANVNIAGNFVWSALHSAIGSPEVIKILLEWGADVSQVNQDGNTALEEAVEQVKRWSKLGDAGVEAIVKDTQDCVDLLEAKFQK